MKRFFFHAFSTIAIPMICCWSAAIYIDPEHVFKHNTEKKMAQILNSHGEVSGVCNINERAFKRLIITSQNHHKNNQTIFLGSSRVMTLDSSAVGSSSPTLNLGMSGACYLDIVGVFLLLKETNAVKGNHLVIGLDPWMFSRNQRNTFSRWETFLGILKAHGYLTTKEWVRAELRRLKKILASHTFQAMLLDGENCTPQIHRDPKKNTFSKTGTLTYPTHVASKPSCEAQEAIEQYIKGDLYRLSRETGLDGFEAKVASFLSLKNEVEKLGGTLTFVLNPYPTQVHDYLQACVPLWQDAKWSAQTKLNAIGDWRFSRFELSDSLAFFDGAHLRPKVANDYYRSLLSLH